MLTEILVRVVLVCRCGRRVDAEADTYQESHSEGEGYGSHSVTEERLSFDASTIRAPEGWHRIGGRFMCQSCSDPE
jgi:hypothetical protein